MWLAKVLQGCVAVDRVFVCERCTQQVRVCHRCDHGQRYCRDGCAALARRESVRRAGRRYQQSAGGRRCHARRQSEYRRRRAQKVTHQGFCPPSDCEKVELHNARQEVDHEGIEMEDEATGSVRECTRGAAVRALRVRHAERCAWCGAAGEHFIRFGYWRR